jgi:hypothetical protein
MVANRFSWTSTTTFLMLPRPLVCLAVEITIALARTRKAFRSGAILEVVETQRTIAYINS